METSLPLGDDEAGPQGISAGEGGLVPLISTALVVVAGWHGHGHWQIRAALPQKTVDLVVD